jgi:hypothetical protein
MIHELLASISLQKTFSFSGHQLFRFNMDEDRQSKNDPLDQLINWLRSECGSSVHIFRGTSSTDLPYVHVWSSKPPKDLTFLPSFHLIFTLKSGSTFDLHLLAFNGKIIDTCQFDLVKHT